MPGLTFEQIHQKLVEKFGDAVGPLSPPKKDPFCVFAGPRLREICRFLKDAPELYFDFLEDLTATDHPKENLIRVVYHFYSCRHTHLFIAKVELDRKDPQVDSLEPLWKAANWMEREVFDLFGVTFKGHPDLRRILMPDDWVGTPLRKDYVEAGGYPGISELRDNPLDLYPKKDRPGPAGKTAAAGPPPPRTATAPAAPPNPRSDPAHQAA